MGEMTEPFHSGPHVFSHFAVLSPKNNEADCIDKKWSYKAREFKVHTTGKDDSVAQFTLGQLLIGCARMQT